MSADLNDTEWLARELLAVSTTDTPDAATVAAVRQQLDAVRIVLRYDAGNAPSQSVLRRAEAIFQPVPMRRAQPVIERLHAAVTFDSRVARPGFGFRGGNAATMVRYEVGDVLLDIEIRPSDSSRSPRFDITGQLDGAPDGPITVELRTPDGDIVAETVQDEFGSFTFSVSPATYDLVARFGSTELTVPALVVG